MTYKRQIIGPLPGMAAVALWMILLSCIGMYGVMTRRLPALTIIICVFFALASTGLIRQRRWGWALSLAAVFLSMCYEAYVILRFHQLQLIIMVFVNLVFFLYLVRPQVIERLR
ncbi:MAG TPA: DUF2127 domain-containing protein [Alloacidobacterium sp.]|jgi:uncharacterized membrane protein (DUF2068 family)|nr:DUF2127 domain-containing protein [Alloacidobacterium sp.]